MKKLILPLLFTFLSASAAEYKGEDIDGNTYDCVAYSYSTGNYYYTYVEFDGDVARLIFSNGGYIYLTMDDEVIEDADDIDCYDYNTGIYWELNVDLD